MNKGSTHIQVVFKLQRVNDYPPASRERIWAKLLNDTECQVDSIPFFVNGISLGDVITIVQRKDKYHFAGLVAESGHSTLRVIFFDEGRISSLRSELRKMGCSSELFSKLGLIAIDVPPNVSLQNVAALLTQGENQGYWEYEEAALSDKHHSSS